MPKRDCCQREANLRVVEIRDRHSVTTITDPDYRVDLADAEIRARVRGKEITQRCVACGARHIIAFVQRGQLGLVGR